MNGKCERSIRVVPEEHESTSEEWKNYIKLQQRLISEGNKADMHTVLRDLPEIGDHLENFMLYTPDGFCLLGFCGTSAYASLYLEAAIFDLPPGVTVDIEYTDLGIITDKGLIL